MSDSDPGNSLIGTPTYTISLIWLFFLLAATAFQAAEHFLRMYFERREQYGVVEVIKKLVEELTLLGLISVILMAIAPPIESICVTPPHNSWTMLSLVDGCPCCLQDTQYVNICTQAQHGCRWASNTSEPYCGCAKKRGRELPPPEGQVCHAADVAETQLLMRTAGNLLLQVGEVCGLQAADVAGVCGAAALGSQTDLRNVTNQLFRTVAEHLWNVAQDPQELRRRSRSLLTAGGRAQAATPLEQLGRPDARGASVHFTPHSQKVKCTGRFAQMECSEGKAPVISELAMDQVHLWIFVVSLSHVTCAAVMMGLGWLRLQQWKRWELQSLQVAASSKQPLPPFRQGAGLPPPVSPAASAALASPAAVSSDDEGPSEFSHEASSYEGEAQGSPLDIEAQGAASPEVAAAGQTADEGAIAVEESAAPITTAANGVTRTAMELPPPASPPAAKAALLDALGVFASFRHQRTVLVRRRSLVLREALIVFIKIFWPNMVTERDFLLCRETVIRTFCPVQPFHFVRSILLFLSFDAAALVGISIEMWLVAIIGVLLSGVISDVAGLLLALGTLSLIMTHAVLIVRLRYATRGGHANLLELEEHHKWWQRFLSRLLYEWHWPLKVVMRSSLFICSFIWASMALFAWQFGVDSCFFRDGTPMFSYFWGMPFWAGLILTMVFFLYLCLVTFPAYTLASHLRPVDTVTKVAEKLDVRKMAVLPHVNRKHRGASSAATAEPADIEKELLRLRQENELLSTQLQLLSGTSRRRRLSYGSL